MGRPFDLIHHPLKQGYTLVEASAGTGKTYSITWLVTRLLLEKQIEIEHILVVTFTIAATEELDQRIRAHLTSLLGRWPRDDQDEVDEELAPLYEALSVQQRAAGPERLQRALDHFDLAQISTIHGFCGQLLRDFSLEAGIEVNQVQTHLTPLLEEVAEDYRSLVLSSASHDALRLMNALSKQLKHQTEHLMPIARHLEGGGWAEVLCDALVFPDNPGIPSSERLQELARASKSEKTPLAPPLFPEEEANEVDDAVSHQDMTFSGGKNESESDLKTEISSEAPSLFELSSIDPHPADVSPHDVIQAWDYIGAVFKNVLNIQIIPALLRDDLRQSLADELAKMNQVAVWKGGGGEAVQSVGWTAIERIVEVAHSGGSVTAVITALHKDLAYLSTSVIVRGLNRSKKKQNADFFDFSHPLSDLIDQLAGVMEKVTDGLRGWFRWGFVNYAQRELSQRKHAEGWMSPSDLIRYTFEALHKADGLFLNRAQARFRAALIDEFQDTDPLQWGIFEAVLPADQDTITYLIGDPKQSIYRFRGADLNAYLAVKGLVSPERTFTMARNFRSDPRVLNALNQHFDPRKEDLIPNHWDEVPAGEMSSGEGFFLDERVPYVHVDGGRTNRADSLPAVRWRYFDLELKQNGRDERLAEYVAEDVCLYLSQGHQIGAEGKQRPIGLNDIGILTRTNQFARDVASALARRGIASTIRNDASVFKTSAAAQLERFMRAMLLPEDEGALRAALSSPLLAMDAREVRERSEELRLVFITFHQIWLNQGFAPAFQQLLHHPLLSFVERALRQVDGARDLSQLMHTAERVQARMSSAGLTPELTLQWLRDRRLETDVEPEEADLVRPHVDSDAVEVVTVHRSKGLEYPILFCPDLWIVNKPKDGDLRVSEPDTPGELRTLDLRLNKSASRDVIFQKLIEAERREERRLLYVALTRAAHHCSIYLAVGARYFGEGTLLPMLMGVAPLPSKATRKQYDSLIQEHAQIRFLRSEGEVTFEIEHRVPSQTVWSVGSAEQHPLAVHHPRNATRENWQVASFSSLADVIQAKAGGRLSLEELPELDEASYRKVVAPLRFEGADPPLLNLTGSARFGQCIHALLQRLDFAECTQSDLERLTAVMLKAWGFEDQQVERVSLGIWLALDTPLAAPEPSTELGGWAKNEWEHFNLSDFSLRDLSRSHRRDEVQFDMLLSRNEVLSGALLNRILRLDPACQRLPLFPDSFKLEGQLKGSIDLMFRVQRGGRDRYYLADYKTHWLGDEGGAQLGHYHPEALHSVMGAQLYLLQSHLYQVVLYRLLKERLGDSYRHDEMFGGSYFLFLRGMSGELSRIRALGLDQGTAGVYVHRPPSKVTELLSLAFSDPQEVSRQLDTRFGGRS